MFQSPSGDSLFSDRRKGCSLMFSEEELFQSPSGDSLFSDKIIERPHPLVILVSIP